jgi:MOSC domain-containing protein YiiM
MTARIHTLLIGVPEIFEDDRGTWQSGINKHVVKGPVYLGVSGLTGNRVFDTLNHGKPDQAVCCHPLEHYRHWNAFYDADEETGFRPGSVGENWTIIGANETDTCIGDVYEVGNAVVQVTAPRYPCSKLERKVKRPGFLREVVASRRTGWYLRVLTPGEVAAGDSLVLADRPNPGVTLSLANECMFGEIDIDAAERLVAANGLYSFWRDRVTEKLEEAKAQPTLFSGE